MTGSLQWYDVIFMMLMGAAIGLVASTVFTKTLEEVSDFVTLHRQAHVRHLVSEFEKLLNKREKCEVESGKPEALFNHEGKDADPS